MLQLGFLKLLYGAPMRENRDKYPCEFCDSPPYEVVSTPWLSEDELTTLRGCEDALDRLYNSGRFLITLDYLINEVGLTPFALFCDFGKNTNGGGMSLGNYALAVLEFFESKCDGELLREKLACDLLCSVDALQIPDKIKPLSKYHKRVRAKFGPDYRVAVLEKSGRIFAVDKNSKKDLFGRYRYKFFSFSETEYI